MGYGVRMGNYFSEVCPWFFSQEMIRVPRLAGSSGAQKHSKCFLGQGKNFYEPYEVEQGQVQGPGPGSVQFSVSIQSGEAALRRGI